MAWGQLVVTVVGAFIGVLLAEVVLGVIRQSRRRHSEQKLIDERSNRLASAVYDPRLYRGRRPEYPTASGHPTIVRSDRGQS